MRKLGNIIIKNNMKTFEDFKEEAKNIIAIFDAEWATNIEYQECWDRMQDLVRELAES